MECPQRIYSLVKQWTGFQVWRICAWGGFLSCPQPWPLHVIWNFTQLPTKLRLDWTVARRVFIRCHSKSKQILRCGTEIRAPVVTIIRCKTRWQVRNVYVSMWLWIVLLFSTAAESFKVKYPLKWRSDTVGTPQTKSRRLIVLRLYSR